MSESDTPSGIGRFLTLADTAEVLNISLGQAYSLVRSGELPAIKVGGQGRWRVENTVLEGYIEKLYEESRRLALWKQADYSSGEEVAFLRPGAGTE
ncbi:MAG: DNA-binding protein [Glaciihabitans sp.]|nr:DNA-binding protein [Glaciihabitans sp.]